MNFTILTRCQQGVGAIARPWTDWLVRLEAGSAASRRSLYINERAWVIGDICR